MELLNNAWMGWSQYIDDGKYAVLLLGALLYLWAHCLSGGKGKRPAEIPLPLVIYATALTVFVILPPTAAVLMLYQTKFYDYIWLWTWVPVTLIIAFVGTLIYQSCYNRYWRGRILKPAALVLFGLAMLLLCGNLGGGKQNALTGSSGIAGGSHQNSLEERTRRIMDELTENGNNKDICLWAPQVLLESARAVNGSVKLLYGRDMWEKSLSGYSYDEYDEITVGLYEYMESLCSQEETIRPEGEPDPVNSDELAKQAYKYANEAFARGVNTIILPDSIYAEVVKGIEEVYNRQEWRMVTGQDTEGYLLFTK